MHPPRLTGSKGGERGGRPDRRGVGEDVRVERRRKDDFLLQEAPVAPKVWAMVRRVDMEHGQLGVVYSEGGRRRGRRGGRGGGGGLWRGAGRWWGRRRGRGRGGARRRRAGEWPGGGSERQTREGGNRSGARGKVKRAQVQNEPSPPLPARLLPHLPPPPDCLSPSRCSDSSFPPHPLPPFASPRGLPFLFLACVSCAGRQLLSSGSSHLGGGGLGGGGLGGGGEGGGGLGGGGEGGGGEGGGGGGGGFG